MKMHVWMICLVAAGLLIGAGCSRKEEPPAFEDAQPTEMAYQPTPLPPLESAPTGPESGSLAEDTRAPEVEPYPVAPPPPPPPVEPAPKPRTAPRPRETPPPQEQEPFDTPPPHQVVTRPEEPREPPPPPEPVTVTVPAGTPIPVKFETGLTTKTAKVGDSFRTTLTDDIRADGGIVLPAGTRVNGEVTTVERLHGGGAKLGFDLVSIVTPDGKEIPIQASFQEEKAGRSKKKKAGTTVAGAAGGALLGQIIGKDTKGTIIGAAVGGAIAGGIAYGDKGDVKIEPGTQVEATLDTDLTLPRPEERTP